MNGIAGIEAWNIAGRWTLARAEARCWQCRALTPVYAIVMESHAEVTFDANEEPEVYSGRIVISGLAAMDDDSAAKIAAAAPSFHRAESKTAGRVQWANHCASCGAMQGEFFLHSEPDGPFFSPSSLDVLPCCGIGFFDASNFTADGHCDGVELREVASF